MDKLQEEIKNLKLSLARTRDSIKDLAKELKHQKKVESAQLQTIFSLEKKLIIKKHKLTLEKSVIKSRGEEYLLVDFTPNLSVVVATKNKNGKWGKKRLVLGAYDFEKGGLITEFMDIKF